MDSTDLNGFLYYLGLDQRIGSGDFALSIILLGWLGHLRGLPFLKLTLG